MDRPTGGWITVVEADGWLAFAADRATASTVPVDRVATSFDVVLANIRAHTLVALTGAVAARVAPAGRLALSGLSPVDLLSRVRDGAAPVGQTRGVPVADPILDSVVDRLVLAGCVAAEDEAAEFLAAAPDEATLEAWLCRREQGEPPAWITSTVLFCGQTLYMAPGVYVPRSQSEELARRAVALLPDKGRAVDLCTGAGAVAAHLVTQVPTAAVIGIDVDVRAAACARRNGVPTAVADLADPLRGRRTFDLVTAVAPYVPTGAIRLLPADVQRYEPRVALDGGADGLDLVRQVVAAAGDLLRPGGWLLIEVGGDQDEALASTLATVGFDNVTPWWDDDGDLRGIASKASGHSGP